MDEQEVAAPTARIAKTVSGPWLGVILLLAISGLAGAAAGAPALPPNIAAAAADPIRGDQAKLDAQRHGPEILAFAGVKSGAKVVDLIPGGGYWTTLLAKAVGSGGQVYAVWPTQYEAADGKQPAAYRALVSSPDYANVTVLEQSAAVFTAPQPVDLILTSQNYHDYNDKFMGPVDLAVLNSAVFAALKPGGVYLVIDHVAAAGSGLRDTDTLHRIDPAAVKAQVQQAGFRFVGESQLLANPQDDHTKAVFDKSIAGHTDQFIFKFEKPLHAKP